MRYFMAVIVMLYTSLVVADARDQNAAAVFTIITDYETVLTEHHPVRGLRGLSYNKCTEPTRSFINNETKIVIVIYSVALKSTTPVCKKGEFTPRPSYIDSNFEEFDITSIFPVRQTPLDTF